MNTVKFVYICFCWLIAIFSYRFRYSGKDWAFLAAGMTFTVISDYHLLLYDNQSAGLFWFCFVHIAYIMRVSPLSYLYVIGATVLCAVPLFVVGDPLLANALLYACLFIQDIAANIRYCRDGTAQTPDAWASRMCSIRPAPAGRLLALAGLILFALCDINVLLFNLPRYITVPDWLPHMGYVLIWVFYAPAQFLLAISVIRFNNQRIVANGKS